MMLQEVAKLVSEIYNQPEAEVFRAPVDWNELNLPQYPIIIKNPIDLGTILSNYNKGMYSYEYDLINDVRQVWINCMIFNQGGSDLYALGEYFAVFFENELKERRKQRHVRATDVDAIPTELEKKKLDHLLLIADPETLGNIVNYLSIQSPEALARIAKYDDMIEINIDAIPPRVFREVLTTLDNTTPYHYSKKIRR